MIGEREGGLCTCLDQKISGQENCRRDETCGVKPCLGSVDKFAFQGDSQNTWRCACSKSPNDSTKREEVRKAT